MADLFEKRIRRAEALEKQWPFAKEVLAFFKDVTAAQEELYRKLAAEKMDQFQPSWFLLQNWVTPFLERIERNASEEVRELLEGWRTLDNSQWHPLLTFGWASPCKGPPDHEYGDDPNPIFVKLVLQGFAMWFYPSPKPVTEPDRALKECPSCLRPPLVSVLREDKQAETVRRSFYCSFCPTEWEFPRVQCPNCNEDRPDKLPRYTAQEIPWMRIEGCDSCRKFLKSVDLTLNWEAEPLVDELASLPLDVIAREHGYEKIAPNLAGL